MNANDNDNDNENFVVINYYFFIKKYGYVENISKKIISSFNFKEFI
jgi:hypothetical protein